MFWLRLAGVAAALFLAGFVGWRLRDDRAAHHELAVSGAREARTAANQAAGDKVADAHAQAAQALAQAHETIVRRIYVPVQSDRECVVPTGLVRLLNDAAAGLPTDPAPGRPDAAPAGVALSAVGASVADNYGLANACRQQLVDLQAWERSQQ